MCTDSHNITSVQSHLQIDVEINYLFFYKCIIILKGGDLNAAINFTDFSFSWVSHESYTPTHDLRYRLCDPGFLHMSSHYYGWISTMSFYTLPKAFSETESHFILVILLLTMSPSLRYITLSKLMFYVMLLMPLNRSRKFAKIFKAH